MKLAIIGFTWRIDDYLPENVTEIVSGGAKHTRNREIIDCADEVLAFRDGKSRGTESVIAYCKDQDKGVTVLTQDIKNAD